MDQPKEMMVPVEPEVELADAPTFSPWGQGLLDRLRVADVQERKQCALVVRQEALDAAETVAAGARGLYEACALVAMQKLYLEYGYGSVEAWIQKEIVPNMTASAATITRLRSATRMYAHLAERYPGSVRSGAMTVQLLEQEWRRQGTDKALLAETEYEEMEGRVVAGRVRFRELDERLRARKEARAALAPRRPAGDSGQKGRIFNVEHRRPEVDLASPESIFNVENASRRQDPVKRLDALELEVRLKGGVTGAPRKAITAPRGAEPLAEELEKLLAEVERVPVFAWQDVPEEKLAKLVSKAKAGMEAIQEAMGYLRASQSYELEEMDDQVTGAGEGPGDEPVDDIEDDREQRRGRPSRVA